MLHQVATGGTPKADPTFCEKYPTAHDCQTRDELPMLLILPRINDFTGGFTMLVRPHTFPTLPH